MHVLFSLNYPAQRGRCVAKKFRPRQAALHPPCEKIGNRRCLSAPFFRARNGRIAASGNEVRLALFRILEID